MALQFDTNSDDVSITLPLSVGGSDQPTIFMGWFKPESSLVASAGFGKAGASPGWTLHVGATDTSTLQVQYPTATTTWVWHSGETNILVLNEWMFWAILGNAQTTTDIPTVAAWAGTLQSPPVELTMSVTTTGSGNISGGGTTGFVGTTSSSVTTAQLGTHEHVCVCGVGAAGVNNPLAVTTAGAITADTKYLALTRVVRPYWAGILRDPSAITSPRLSSNYFFFNYGRYGGVGCTAGFDMERRAGSPNNAQPFVGSTGTGAVATLERAPRSYGGLVTPLNLWCRR